MRTFVLLVAFSAQLLATSAYGVAYKMGATACDSNTSEKNCKAAHCSWCSSAAVGASCYTAEDSKALPSSIFQCSKVELEADKTCDTNKKEKDCMAAKSGTDYCSWCNSAAVGGTCFTESDAKTLPSSIYACEYQKHALKAATNCDAQKSEKNCMSASQDKDKCSWCLSAAVGGTCFTEPDAKSLPSSVFSCEYQKTTLKAATACEAQKDTKSCKGYVGTDGKCAWCNSAAVGGTCFTEADAHTLPSSVFQCEYSTPASYAQ